MHATSAFLVANAFAAAVLLAELHDEDDVTDACITRALIVVFMTHKNTIRHLLYPTDADDANPDPDPDPDLETDTDEEVDTDEDDVMDRHDLLRQIADLETAFNHYEPTSDLEREIVCHIRQRQSQSMKETNEES
jgi:hypothetical protein